MSPGRRLTIAAAALLCAGLSGCVFSPLWLLSFSSGSDDEAKTETVQQAPPGQPVPEVHVSNRAQAFVAQGQDSYLVTAYGEPALLTVRANVQNALVTLGARDYEAVLPSGTFTNMVKRAKVRPPEFLRPAPKDLLAAGTTPLEKFPVSATYTVKHAADHSFRPVSVEADYSLRVEKAGFKPVNIESILIRPGRETVLDLQLEPLEPGAAAETTRAG